MSQKNAFDKLIHLLRELFQLDQPDLDFGLYRIMHTRADEISQFLDRDLLPQVKDAFSHYKPADKADLEKELQQAIEQAHGLGVDPESTAKVQELRQKIAEQGVDVIGLEQEVYDHLYKFFRRYYHEGDFLAKRVYKPGVYAIPYEGEEVKLHWANKDQYYIKTSEYLRDYAFTLKPGADDPIRVHFRLVDAAEGEHGNVKESEGKNRVFILAGEDFIAEEDGESGKELVIRFEYRPATMEDWSEDARANATPAAKKKPPTQKDLREDAVRRVLAVQDDSLKPWLAELVKNHIKADGEQADYSRLAAHLNRYTARNTFDYFIHKDLGGFLRRELDFYIKNEVMHLDDIESETAPRVEQYLSKIKVIRQIAGKIIDFLAQLEDFQKKLWLKKKFVTETSYCIRVGCIPEEFYPEIAANETQRQEWVDLHAIDEIEPDLTTVAYSEPLTVEFLKAHPTLMVDTRHFDDVFSQRLLEAMGDIDGQIDGMLFNSENFHALSTLQRKCRGRIDVVYTDPPYNKGGQDDFAYKDNFQHSSWIAMIYDRLLLTNNILKDNSCLFFSVDENEFNNLYFVGNNLIGHSDSKALPAITNLKGNQDTEGFASCHEYVVVFARNSLSDISRLRIDEEDLNDGWQEDEYGLFKQADGLRATGANAPREKRPNLWYPIFFLPDGSDFYTTEGDQPLDPCHIAVWPINDEGNELSWYWKKEKVNDEKHNLIIKRARSGAFTLYKKQRPGIGDIPTRKPKSFFYLPEYSSTHGGNLAKDLFGKRMSSFTPKSVRLIQDLVWLGNDSEESLVLDFFAGSGTTGHAIINLNRGDGGHRKFILVEMGSHFDDTVLPRLKKTVYSPKWKNGKPNRHATVSEAERSPRLMKVVRLESYEDALNNLEPRRTQTQSDLLISQQAQGADGLREQYLLRYWLDVETPLCQNSCRLL